MFDTIIHSLFSLITMSGHFPENSHSMYRDESTEILTPVAESTRRATDEPPAKAKATKADAKTPKAAKADDAKTTKVEDKEPKKGKSAKASKK